MVDGKERALCLGALLGFAMLNNNRKQYVLTGGVVLIIDCVCFRNRLMICCHYYGVCVAETGG